MNRIIKRGLHCTHPEYIFCSQVKNIIKGTNFEVIAEELDIKCGNKPGKIDLWLINKPVGLLVSLELKVGKQDDNKKKKKLREQVYRYTNALEKYNKFPYNIYGLGLYKNTTYNYIQFIHYMKPTNNECFDEIDNFQKLCSQKFRVTDRL